MEHQPLGENTSFSFFFLFSPLLFFPNVQAEATTPRDQGYGMKIMFYPISVALSSTPGLLVRDHRAGRGSGQAEQIFKLINPRAESCSPREGVLPG